MKINSILSTKKRGIITIRGQRPIREAIALLAEHNIGALVVVDREGRLTGIISERDIVRTMVTNDEILSLAVQDVMTKEVIVGLPQDDIASVAHTMTERRFRHLPVVEEGRLLGIISIGDVLKAQRDKYKGEIDTLETQILADQGLA